VTSPARVGSCVAPERAKSLRRARPWEMVSLQSILSFRAKVLPWAKLNGSRNLWRKWRSSN